MSGVQNVEFIKLSKSSQSREGWCIYLKIGLCFSTTQVHPKPSLSAMHLQCPCNAPLVYLQCTYNGWETQDTVGPEGQKFLPKLVSRVPAGYA